MRLDHLSSRLLRASFGLGLLALPAACLDDTGPPAPTPDGDAQLAVEPAQLLIDGTACDTPAVTSATIRNRGDGPSGPLVPRLDGRDAEAFSIVASTCGASLAAGASCTLDLSVRARGDVTLEASLLVGEGAQLATTPVTSPAAIEGHLEIVGFDGVFGVVEVDLPAVGAPRRNVHIRNTGDGALPPIELAIAGGSAFHLLSSTCGAAPLCAGDSCLATVGFRPTALGAQETTLTIHTGEDHWTGTFSGTGVAPSP